MRKTLLSAAMMVACISVSAQKLTYIPWTENALMKGTVISNNGKFVGGSDTEGRGFIYDTTTGQIKYFQSPKLGGDDEQTQTSDADVRWITDDGIGVGYIEECAAKFNFATGEYEKILDENSLVNYISSDGTMFGCSYDNAYIMTPIMIVNGKKTELPQATDSWLGYESDGMNVRGGNADGSVLLGLAHDNFDTSPIVMWALNKDKKAYSVVPVSKKYLDASFALDGPQKFDKFEGAAISQNGKYVALILHDKTKSDEGMSIARYNVDTDTYDEITCPEASDGMLYYADAISNDGTIVGYIVDETGARSAMICKGGETEAKKMSEVYPTLADIAKMDANQNNTPCGITPDGRYIVGFGYVDMDDNNLCWGTYVIDTQATDGVDNATAEAKSNKVVASYTVDGKKTRPAANRLHINKFADGRTLKVVK